MRCPSLVDLPDPPSGKTGWPWTVESPRLSDAMPDGRPWPQISIVTPSFNQGQYLEETIRSVLLQGYPDLQYVIMDGGSTDNSVEIIRKYSHWLNHWESKKDQGQAHAINKGLALLSGEVGTYLNSDDLLLRRSLGYVGNTFRRYEWDILLGRNTSNVTFESWLFKRSYWQARLVALNDPLLCGEHSYQVCQESSYWNLGRFRDCRFDESLMFCMDYDWFQRLAPGSKILQTSRKLGHFRRHADSKSQRLDHVKIAENAIVQTKNCEIAISREQAEPILNAHKKRHRFAMLSVPLGLDAHFLYRHP
ncbi:glycosyltransferase family 2 protein [Hyphomicrobium facile]|uniref:Glycosyl transferase family 2 n=1 Tax=Hyphomicrobium facile TaxID=51670 RepID=A0A1I7NDT6_9HYPH|nr:Glycosyl transferase family 2 [Hyphomicrobium facile]